MKSASAAYLEQLMGLVFSLLSAYNLVHSAWTQIDGADSFLTLGLSRAQDSLGTLGNHVWA